MGDRVQVKQVAEVDGGEERVFASEPCGGEVGQRSLGGAASLEQVGAVSSGLEEQRAGADHRALVVAAKRRIDHAVVADVVGVQTARLKQAAAHPFVGFLGELQILDVVGDPVELQRELCGGSVGD